MVTWFLERVLPGIIISVPAVTLAAIGLWLNWKKTVQHVQRVNDAQTQRIQQVSDEQTEQILARIPGQAPGFVQPGPPLSPEEAAELREKWLQHHGASTEPFTAADVHDAEHWGG